MILDYPSGPSLIACVLKSGRRRQKSGSERRLRRTQPTIAGFQDGEGSHEPRNVGGCEKLKQARKQLLI